MAKSQPRITLSVSRDIPFNKLVLSQANVRRIKAGVAVEELAGVGGDRRRCVTVPDQPWARSAGGPIFIWRSP